MKRPAFQFYTKDWLSNAKLRRCSAASRGAWIDVLCLLHGADEYGILRWPLADIANAAGLNVKLLKELADKGVLKGGDKGCEPYIFTPTHAGKTGAPVTLIPETKDPVWYCSRFVRDEYIRLRRGTSTRFDGENNQPKARPKTPPKPSFGDGKGDGPAFASASANNPLSPAHDDRLDLPGLTGYHPEDWQPDQTLLDGYLAKAGIPMPSPEDLANALTRFNLNFTGKPLTTGETYSRLVRWLSEDYRRGKQTPTRAGPAAGRPRGFEAGDAAGAEWLAEERAREAFGGGD